MKAGAKSTSSLQAAQGDGQPTCVWRRRSFRASQRGGVCPWLIGEVALACASDRDLIKREASDVRALTPLHRKQRLLRGRRQHTKDQLAATDAQLATMLWSNASSQ